MKKRVLVTGGAGFIGSHVARELVDAGYSVRVFDNLDAQVHGELATRPQYLPEGVELVCGDVRDPAAVRGALEDIDAVYHFAASVGVGQSMHRIHDYTDVNDLGTACLLEAIVENPIDKLIVASSMSIYGEGLYVDLDGRPHENTRRTTIALADGDWEPRDNQGRTLQCRPTPETKAPALESIYALGKHAQEQAALIIGRAYDIPIVALRLFNVYGPHPALSNPYAGAIALFASRCLNDRPPKLFEDGEQRRDFVHVDDVARACRLALESESANGMTLNIGSGASHSVRDVAARVSRALGRPQLQPHVTGEYRLGDVRHCFADISLAREVLGYTPKVDLDTGLNGMTEWWANHVAIERVSRPREMPRGRGLML